MENFLFCLNVILPIFAAIGIGYLVRLLKWVDDEALLQFNNVCFKVFLSILLFMNVYNSDIKEVFDLKLILFACISIFVSFLTLFFIVPRIEKDRFRHGAMVQGAFRSNFLLFAIPIAQNLYGESGLGSVALMICIVVIMFNTLSVFALEYFRCSAQKISFGCIVTSMAKNPLILGSVFGLLFVLFKFRLPPALEAVGNDFADAASPLALFILGASLKFTSVKNNLRPLMICLLNKLVIIPSLFIPLAIWMGFKNLPLTMLITLYATPVAVSSFTMVQQTEGDSELAGLIVVFSCLFSVLSIFFWLYISKQMGLL